MNEQAIAKGLEVWILQNLLNGSILLGILASGLVLTQAYYQELEKHLSLRVSLEAWRLLTVVLPDFLLAMVALVSLVAVNPDVMADIKMALPFYPLAALVYIFALGIRLFRGGHQVGSRPFRLALRVCLAASLLNYLGFTLVAEAPGHEYLARHSNPVWVFVRTHLRSNADPAGIDFAQWVFWVYFTILLALGGWAVITATRQVQTEPKEG
jgi:hypothetical protein